MGMNDVTMMNDERQDYGTLLSLIVRAANTDICINKRIWYDRTTCVRNNAGTDQGQSGRKASIACAIQVQALLDKYVHSTTGVPVRIARRECQATCRGRSSDRMDRYSGWHVDHIVLSTRVLPCQI